jgi:hypothetical protein
VTMRPHADEFANGMLMTSVEFVDILVNNAVTERSGRGVSHRPPGCHHRNQPLDCWALAFGHDLRFAAGRGPTESHAAR